MQPFEFSHPFDANDLLNAYEEHGFVLLRQFLDASHLDRLQAEIDRYIREVVPTLPATDVFYHDSERPETLKQMHRMEVDPYFASLRTDPRWLAVAEAALGDRVEALSPEWFNKPPGVPHPTPAHQDNYYFQFRPARALTMWLALDDVDEENGCLRYVSGSHREGLRPHEPSRRVGFSQHIPQLTENERQREVTVTLRRGDLAVHHCETIHRAEANLSDRRRRAFAIVFRGQGVSRDEEAFRAYLAALSQNQASG